MIVKKNFLPSCLATCLILFQFFIQNCENLYTQKKVVTNKVNCERFNLNEKWSVLNNGTETAICFLSTTTNYITTTFHFFHPNTIAFPANGQPKQKWKLQKNLFRLHFPYGRVRELKWKRLGHKLHVFLFFPHEKLLWWITMMGKRELLAAITTKVHTFKSKRAAKEYGGKWTVSSETNSTEYNYRCWDIFRLKMYCEWKFITEICI